MRGILQLAPESIDHISSFLDSAGATSFACTTSTFRDAGQRAVFRNAVFRSGNVDERLLQFMRSLYARPDMGKYVIRLHIEPVLPIAHLGQRESVLKTIDGLWPHLPGLRRLTLLWHSSLAALTFDGCTDGLSELVVSHCTENMQALLRRNRGLLYFSVFAPLDVDDARRPGPVPADTIPRLQRARADLDTLLALIPGRDITILCISQPVSLDLFMNAAPALAEATAQLKKLYIFLSIGDSLSVLCDWAFIGPLARHMSTLESLAVKFSLSWFEFTDVIKLCANIPNTLKTLKTLRLWLPGPLGNAGWRDPLKEFSIDTIDDDLSLVERAHRQCPSLRHASLLHRIDWHRLDAGWVPIVAGSHKRALEFWLMNRDLRPCDLDAAETDSLVSEPTAYVEYEPISDDDDSSDDGYTESSHGSLMAELEELSNENNNLPPAGSGLSYDAWHDVLEAAVQDGVFRPFSPVPDPEIAALLQEVQEASHSGTNAARIEAE